MGEVASYLINCRIPCLYGTPYAIVMPGRGERIRTSGLYVPNVALYQAKLHPDALMTAAFITTNTGLMIAVNCESA
jgi:hypothetical protein